MNSYNAIGNIGRDAELRYTADQTPVLIWSLAVSHGFGKNAGTTWMNCSLYGKRAESLEKYIKKGNRLGISGEIMLREYETKDGVKRQSLECRIDDVTLLSDKDSDAPQTEKAQVHTPEPSDDFDESIPF